MGSATIERNLVFALIAKAERNVGTFLCPSGIPVPAGSASDAMNVHGRVTDIFDFGGTLGTLDPKTVSNLDKARENAPEFAGEVLLRLKQAAQAEKVVS